VGHFVPHAVPNNSTLLLFIISYNWSCLSPSPKSYISDEFVYRESCKSNCYPDLVDLSVMLFLLICAAKWMRFDLGLFLYNFTVVVCEETQCFFNTACVMRHDTWHQSHLIQWAWQARAPKPQGPPRQRMHYFCINCWICLYEGMPPLLLTTQGPPPSTLRWLCVACIISHDSKWSYYSRETVYTCTFYQCSKHSHT